jgi:hypothetical protein
LTQTDEVDAAAKVVDCYEHLLKIFVDLEILHVICRWLPIGQRDMREAVGKQRLDETLALMVVSDHRGVAVKQGTPSTRDGRIGIVVMPLVSWIWLKSGALRHHWRQLQRRLRAHQRGLLLSQPGGIPLGVLHRARAISCQRLVARRLLLGAAASRGAQGSAQQRC